MSNYYLQAFGGFCLRRHGEPLTLMPEAERLVAFLGLRGGRMPRPFVAGLLWPAVAEKRALGSLRSVLWRVRKSCPDLVAADTHNVSLSDDVFSDVDDLRHRSEQLSRSEIHEVEGASQLVGSHTDSRGNIPIPVADDFDSQDHRPFALEFLPGWYDEWVLVERERMRQLCLHALESIAAGHARCHRHGAAIQALLSSIMLDEFREAPRRLLISIHLAEGNPTEALREYENYSRLLDGAMGLEPSPAMRDLVNEVTSVSRYIDLRSTIARDVSVTTT